MIKNEGCCTKLLRVAVFMQQKSNNINSSNHVKIIMLTYKR